MNRLFDDWDCHAGEGSSWEIHCGDTTVPAGRTLHLPDVFLGMPERDWLTDRSLPNCPVPITTPARLKLDPVLTDPKIPVIFGDGSFRDNGVGLAYLGIDIFGSAFFMMSRYEELVLPDRDEFDRFPARASIAFRGGFLDRPVVDEYREILWSAMLRLWPRIKRTPRTFLFVPSHDVDRPARHTFHRLGMAMRLSIGDAVKRGRLRWATEGLWQWVIGPRELHPRDPYNTFEAIMDLSDSARAISTFYFFAGRTNLDFDANYDLVDHSIGRLMKRIHHRGHLLGLHGSFETFRRPDALLVEAERFRARCRSLEITQRVLGVRMHFLRWCAVQSWRAMEAAGLDYDATVGFADSPGFRCGTCHEYQAFDAVNQQPLAINVRPLIAMDVSLTHGDYCNLGTYEDAGRVLKRLRAACKVVRGNFSLLWHNSELVSEEQWKCYREALQDGANEQRAHRLSELGGDS
jgi:hypothetical protein